MKIKIDTRILADVLADVSADNKGATAGRITNNNLGVASSPVALTKSNVIENIVNMGTVLDEANCPESDRWLVIPAKMGGLIKQSDLKDASITNDGQSPLRNGRLGMIDRFTVYVSHNISLSGVEFSVLAGHKMGITFASQMTNMETIRSETTFGDIIRGLQVYGYKVVKPEALATLVCSL